MNDERQKTQTELAFPSVGRGETLSTDEEGSESSMAERAPERPATTEKLMEEVCKRSNLEKALKRVQANHGSPGIDGMTVEELPGYLQEHWEDIRKQLLEGRYQPKPVKRVEIPKPNGGKRRLGIPCVLDRLIQQTVLQALQPLWDPTFSEQSYGFRPGRSAHQAVAQAQQYVKEGFEIVVDIDLEKFFDQVNHDVLMSRVARRVGDKRLLRLIRAFLKAGILADGLEQPSSEGTPQGGPLSPLLSNLLLDELDRELERRNLHFVRYADDCNIYVRSKRAGIRVMDSISRFITKKLKLKVNQTKSAVGRTQERKFLGFRLLKGGKRGISPQSKMKFKDKARTLTRRNAGRSLEQLLSRLTSYLRGWRSYFGFCETPSILRQLDGWIRRRLRSYIWRQWRTFKRRRQGLINQGLNERTAAETASARPGPWRVSSSKALHQAFPVSYFDNLALPHLAPR